MREYICNNKSSLLHPKKAIFFTMDYDRSIRGFCYCCNLHNKAISFWRNPAKIFGMKLRKLSIETGLSSKILQKRIQQIRISIQVISNYSVLSVANFYVDLRKLKSLWYDMTHRVKSTKIKGIWCKNKLEVTTARPANHEILSSNFFS